MGALSLQEIIKTIMLGTSDAWSMSPSNPANQTIILEIVGFLDDDDGIMTDDGNPTHWEEGPLLRKLIGDYATDDGTQGKDHPDFLVGLSAALPSAGWLTGWLAGHSILGQQAWANAHC